METLLFAHSECRGFVLYLIATSYSLPAGWLKARL